MTELLRLVRGELGKLADTRTIWAALALAAGAAGALAALEAIASSAAALRTTHHLRVILGLGGGFSVLGGAVVGVLATAGEHHHGTHAPLLVAVPRRQRVVLARVLSCLVAGLAVGLACAVATLAVAAAGLAARGAGFGVTGSLPARIFAGTLVCGAAAGALGAGLGSLMARQGPALAVALAWILLVDGLLGRAVPSLGRFLPGGAQSSLLVQPLPHLLPEGAAALVLAAWAVVVGAAGARVEGRRDVTVGS